MKVMPRPTAARTGLRVRVYFTITQPQGLTEKVPDWGSGDLHANSASEELWGLIFFFFFWPKFYDLRGGDNDRSICPTHMIFGGGSCDVIDAK